MNSRFDELLDRRGTNSLKWDVGPDELPLWVADMDFATAPPVLEAIGKKLELGVLGYQIIPDEYPAAVASWWKRRHGVDFAPETITLTTGTVPAISSMVRSLTQPGDSVVVLTPVYNVFFASIRNSGREISASRLLETAEGFNIDWEDLESRLRDPKTTLLIFCNPHNPTGTIWSAAELARVGELCADNGVSVISDEVHCDLTVPGTHYTPFAAASPTCAQLSATCVAASKAFNIAGIQSGAVVIANEHLRQHVVAGFNRDEVAEPNVIAVEASIAAYTQGEAWLEELREYLFANKAHAAAQINAIAGLKTQPSPATYLLWIDVTGITADSSALTEHLRRTTGLVLSDGAEFDPSGPAHLRMNVACPRARLDDALTRLRAGINSFPDAKPTPSH